ncbi:MAG TPA: hypothetical protein VFO39_13380 [Candidatus Sulfotelmatobacter sp.]|nr:hypothetical protein [Candidatus Sulfotelmatobacter sp.]
MSSVAGFGWEITNLDGNGADIYFVVENAMTLNSLNIDVAFSPTSISATGLTEVLCAAEVSRGGPPAAGFSVVHSSNFGDYAEYNPNGLTIGPKVPSTPPPSPGQDALYTVILKTYVPSNGNAATTDRHVLANSSLSLNAGDYLVFHMDHLGVPGDAEMQVVLNYSLT